jgi:hypothetical protein
LYPVFGVVNEEELKAKQKEEIAKFLESEKDSAWYKAYSLNAKRFPKQEIDQEKQKEQEDNLRNSKYIDQYPSYKGRKIPVRVNCEQPATNETIIVDELGEPVGRVECPPIYLPEGVIKDYWDYIPVIGRQLRDLNHAFTDWLRFKKHSRRVYSFFFKKLDMVPNEDFCPYNFMNMRYLDAKDAGNVEEAQKYLDMMQKETKRKPTLTWSEEDKKAIRYEMTWHVGPTKTPNDRMKELQSDINILQDEYDAEFDRQLDKGLMAGKTQEQIEKGFLKSPEALDIINQISRLSEKETDEYLRTSSDFYKKRNGWIAFYGFILFEMCYVSLLMNGDINLYKTITQRNWREREWIHGVGPSKKKPKEYWDFVERCWTRVAEEMVKEGFWTREDVFNFLGHGYTEAELVEFLKDPRQVFLP